MQQVLVKRRAGSRAIDWRLLALCGTLALSGSGPVLADGSLKVSVEQATVTVKLGERPLVVYRYIENPAKPYVEQLFSPGGANVLRDSPADHKHHHGLMFAVAVDGVDFWSENPNCGRQRHRGGRDPEIVTRHGVDWAVGQQEIDWVAPDGQQVLLRETRQIKVAQLAETAATLVVWHARLEPPAGKKSATLSGSPYFGLGMRFVTSMDTGGQFVNAEGKTGMVGTNNARSAWCAYTAAADGKPVTVAMFDFPNNPRHPATWFTLDQGFAYLSATLNLSKEPLVIEAGKPLRLRYAVAVADGKVEAEKIAALYRRLGSTE